MLENYTNAFLLNKILLDPWLLSTAALILNNVLETTINDIINPSSKQNNKADTSLYEDFDYFDTLKKRQKNWKTLLNALLTINPTSTLHPAS